MYATTQIWRLTRKWRRYALTAVTSVFVFLLYVTITTPRDYVETLDDRWTREPYLTRQGTHNRLTGIEVHTKLVTFDSNRKLPSPITKDGVVLPNNFRYSIDKSTRACVRANYSVFVYVHSAIANFKRREMLRKTWANTDILNQINVGMIFVIGTTSDPDVARKFVRERHYNKDILQINYVDRYENISVKAAAALNWVAINCASHAEFILKTDDDIFVNLERLVNFIQITAPKIRSGNGNRPMLMCNVLKHDQVRRDTDSAWYISREMYAKTHYPPFCTGSVLLMTSDAIRILRLSLNGSRLFPLDDVWMTAIVRHNTGIDLVPINERYALDLKKTLDVDRLKTDFIFGHCSVQNIQILWDYFTRGKTVLPRDVV